LKLTRATINDSFGFALVSDSGGRFCVTRVSDGGAADGLQVITHPQHPPQKILEDPTAPQHRKATNLQSLAPRRTLAPTLNCCCECRLRQVESAGWRGGWGEGGVLDQVLDQGARSGC
jgi:hypothetical protein